MEMANNEDEKETKETNGYDEIDEEIDPDDIVEDRNNKFKHMKTILYAVLLGVIGLTLLWGSFIVGQKIFMAYKSTAKDSLQKNAATHKEMPKVAIDSKADRQVEQETKSGIAVAVPAKIVEPSSDQTEKNHPALEKDIVQRTKIDVTPVPKAESPAPAIKAEMTVPDVKPAVIDSTVKPETKVQKPVAKKKAAVTKTRKKHKQYKVIVGSFSTKANADSLVSQLIVNHYEPMIVWAKTPKGQFYRVIAGSYRSLSEAKAKGAGLEKLGFQPFYIVE
jgi:cell division septation protein DedD